MFTQKGTCQFGFECMVLGVYLLVTVCKMYIKIFHDRQLLNKTAEAVFHIYRWGFNSNLSHLSLNLSSLWNAG